MFAAIAAPTFFVVAIVIWELTSVSGNLVARGEAPIAGASVQLTNERTEQTWDALTDKRGSFVFRCLLPGIYGVKVSADGFADSPIPSIRVTVGPSSAPGKITLHFSRPKTPKELQEDAEDMGRPFTEASWTWTDKHGNTCTFEDLYNALSEHWSWLESGKPRHGPSDEIEIRAMPSVQPPDHLTPAEPARLVAPKCGTADDTAQFDSAKMANAPLSGLTLWGANFTGANLTEANFHGANLFAADFRDARLESASFGVANLQYAKFWGENSDLTGAKFCGADLSRANFTGAAFRGVSFIPCVSTRSSANLSGADFTDANLSGDIGWWGANLADVLFEPKILPNVDEFKGADNLELLTYFHNPRPLMGLREQFRQAGLDQQQDKITYALNRRKSELLWEGCWPWAVAFVPWGESWKTESHQLLRHRQYVQILVNCGVYASRRALLDFTCSYGMNRSRPFLLAGGLWIVGYVAFLVLTHRQGRSGLYFVVKRSIGNKLRTREVRIQPRPVGGTRWRLRALSWLNRERHLLWTTMFFAFLSMFNWDVREVPLMGKAVALVRGREYDFKAKGRMRTLSGLQSWVGGYLILLWLYLLVGHLIS